MKTITIVAVKGIIIRDDKILIIKRSLQDIFAPGGWEFAGGKIDYGESPEEALRREAMEETGLKITVGKILYATSFVRSSVQQNIVLTYLCGTRSGDVVLSEEHEDFLWAEPKQLRDYLLPMICNDLDEHGAWKDLGLYGTEVGQLSRGTEPRG